MEVPIIVTIKATSMNIIARNIVAPLLKKSVPNVDMIINTKNEMRTPVISQISVFPTICHQPGFGGSIVSMVGWRIKRRIFLIEI